MLDGRRIAVVMPAYNAAATVERTYRELPHDILDEILLTDDGSSDATAAVAGRLGLRTLVHATNRGYGANQKTCYRAILESPVDIVVMVHPDYQYSPRLVTALASLITSGHYDVALGSRILGGRARAGGMPRYKYVANRFLTAAQNLICGSKLSEFHTGFRAYSRRFLETVPFERNADGFVFDNQILVQALHFGFEIGEISCPTRYFAEASSIGFAPSVRYGFGVLRTALALRWVRSGGRVPRFLRPRSTDD